MRFLTSKPLWIIGLNKIGLNGCGFCWMMQQDIFTHSVDGMGVQTIEAGEQELKRLRKLKQEKMGDLILEAREKIRSEATGLERGNVFLRPFMRVR